MENLTIEEKNILIAEFMGWKLGHPELLELRWSNEWFEGRDKKTTKGYLHFHTDWNWLMQVVEKIESITADGFDNSDNFFNVTIGCGLYCTIQDAYGEILEIDNCKETKIKTVYSACVEFIQWFNNKK